MEQSVYFVTVILAASIVVTFCISSLDATATLNVPKSVNNDDKMVKSEFLRRNRRQAVPGNGNSLVDELIPDWQAWLRGNGYDPFYVAKYQRRIEPILLMVRDCTLYGLSSFRRTGDVTLDVGEDLRVTADVGIDDISANCSDVEVRWSFTRFYGQLYVRIKDFRIESTIRQRSGKPADLIAVDVINEGDIVVDFNGKGAIGTIVGYIGIPYLIHKIKDAFHNKAEITSFTNEILESIDLDSIVANNFN